MVLHFTAIYAGNLNYIHNYTISEGLAHNGITCALEDSRGYFWLGTFDGLNRYDGYEFITLKNTFDKDIFTSNRIRAVAEDAKGNLIIGTDEGISLYNDQTKLSRIIYTNDTAGYNKRGPVIRHIFVENDQYYCVSEGDGLLIFNSDYQLTQQIILRNTQDGSLQYLTDALILDSTNILALTTKELRYINGSNDNEHTLITFDRPPKGFELVRLNSEYILVTAIDGIELIRIKKTDNSYSFERMGMRLSEYEITCAAQDKNGSIWFGTNQNGILHINNVDSLIHGNYNVSSFSTPTDLIRVSHILTSQSHGCWVSTFNRGIYRFNLNQNPFHGYNTAMNKKYGLYSNLVTFSAPLDDNRCYITAQSGGLALYNTVSHAFEPLPFNLPKHWELFLDFIFVDSQKNLWLNILNRGIYKVPNGSKHPKLMTTLLPELEGIPITSIIEDREHNLWLASRNNLYRLLLDEAGNITNYETLLDDNNLELTSRPSFRCIYEDPLFDFVWVGSDMDGLYRITLEVDTPLEKLTINRFSNDKNNRNSISSNFVSSIIRSPGGQLWVGTEQGGICKVIDSKTNPKFVPLTEKDGLSNNVVKNIWYDNEYNLWVATNIGLNKFDPKTNLFRTFTKEEGLPFEEFKYHISKLGNGYILLSGLKGFCYFNPKKLPNRETLPDIEISNLHIVNYPVNPGDTINGRILLTDPIAQTKELFLNHNENIISFEINSLHFANPKNRFIRYRLDPLSSEWTEVPSDKRFIKYHGLQPGEYTFSYMASNSMNKWTKPKSIQIIIAPPFWKTYKAYIIYVLLFALAGYITIYVVIRIQKLKHKLDIEQLEQNKVNELNEAKLRFFSNISHEIKTPLTLITGPVNLLADRFKSNTIISENLQIVQRQSKKISQLIHQVHDFQKANANALKMNPTRFNFSTFIQDLIGDYEFMARSEKKILKATGADNIHVLADVDKIEKVLNNLLSNSFKHTGENDKITIEFQRIEKNLLVTVIDTGEGIAPEDLPHIFERFYQSKKVSTKNVGGSGIGLAFTKRLVEMHYGYISATSKLGEGSSFEIKLPIITTDAFDQQDEIEASLISAEGDANFKPDFNQDINLTRISISEELENATIFVADDNTDLRMYLSGILSKIIKEVKVFSTGKQCLEAMNNEWPNLVISDVSMPEMNGFDFCKAIKSDIKTCHIPVILLTACTTIDDQIHGLRDGADAYIHKPFQFEHLIAKIDSLLKNRKMLRERYLTNFPLTLEKIQDNSNDVAFLEKFYSLLEKNIDNQDLDLDKFAIELCLNRTHFYQKVKALTDQTPYEIVRLYRLKKAADLLVNKQLTIVEVSEMTGYKSRSHFSRSFKEYYKVTPGKYASDAKSKLT